MYRILSCLSWLLTAALVVVSVLILPEPAAALASETNPTITITDCALIVEYTVLEGATHTISISNNGVEVFSDSRSGLSFGDSVTFIFTPSAPVIPNKIGDFVVRIFVNGAIEVYSNRTLPGVAGCSGGCAVVEGGYQGQFIAPGQLHWSPGKAVWPDTFIPVGQAATIIHNNVPGWYYIVWACGYYYVKTEVMMPNTSRITKPYLTPR
jgi:hypothetical protein